MVDCYSHICCIVAPFPIGLRLSLRGRCISLACLCWCTVTIQSLAYGSERSAISWCDKFLCVVICYPTQCGRPRRGYVVSCTMDKGRVCSYCDKYLLVHCREFSCFAERKITKKVNLVLFLPLQHLSKIIKII